MVINEHPGYAVAEDSRMYTGKTVYIPLKLRGGLGTGWEDDKCRHLSGCIVTDYPCGEGELFNDINDRTLTFDNHPHAENFLNKFVREQVGYQRAWDAWEKYQAEQQEKKDQEILAERRDLLGRLRKQQAEHKRRAALYEAAAELIRIYNEGGISREHLAQVVRMVLDKPGSEDVESIYRDVTESLGLE